MELWHNQAVKDQSKSASTVQWNCKLHKCKPTWRTVALRRRSAQSVSVRSKPGWWHSIRRVVSALTLYSIEQRLMITTSWDKSLRDQLLKSMSKETKTIIQLLPFSQSLLPQSTETQVYLLVAMLTWTTKMKERLPAFSRKRLMQWKEVVLYNTLRNVISSYPLITLEMMESAHLMRPGCNVSTTRTTIQMSTDKKLQWPKRANISSNTTSTKV